MSNNTSGFALFRNEWLRLAHRASDGHSADFYVAFALFEKFASGLDLEFDARVNDMAEEAGLTRRALHVVLRRFEKSGLMMRKAKFGRAATNTYAFTIPSVKRC